MEWFRFYDEVLDDPKVQRLPAALFRDWINVLCLCNRNDPRGVLPPVEDVAFGLRCSNTKAKNTINKLIQAELLVTVDDVTYPNGWHKRQRVSDDVAKRVAEHRARQAAKGVTSNEKSNVTSNGPETLPHARATDTEQNRTDTELTPKPPKAKPAKAKTPEPTAPNGTAVVDTPFALFESMCEQTGVEPAEVPKADKNKNLAVAKRLAESGTTAKDVADITRWLQSQAWRTGGVDMFTIEKERMRWQTAGKPDGSKPTPLRKPPANLQTNKEREDKSVWLGDWPEYTG